MSSTNTPRTEDLQDPTILMKTDIPAEQALRDAILPTRSEWKEILRNEWQLTHREPRDVAHAFQLRISHEDPLKADLSSMRRVRRMTSFHCSDGRIWWWVTHTCSYPPVGPPHCLTCGKLDRERWPAYCAKVMLLVRDELNGQEKDQEVSRDMKRGGTFHHKLTKEWTELILAHRETCRRESERENPCEPEEFVEEVERRNAQACADYLYLEMFNHRKMHYRTVVRDFYHETRKSGDEEGEKERLEKFLGEVRGLDQDYMKRTRIFRIGKMQ
ncbi:hypothetical protein VTL71DRAFT_9000 [Oculimacula yallundae]|uniref:Uncharacterized protein n=1 Tax=Oculimacula yallundae TaxID=86028 RepID=A0ABR4BTK8_9HELO